MAPAAKSSRTHQTLEFKYRCIREVEAGYSRPDGTTVHYDQRPQPLRSHREAIHGQMAPLFIMTKGHNF